MTAALTAGQYAYLMDALDLAELIDTSGRLPILLARALMPHEIAGDPLANLRDLIRLGFLALDGVSNQYRIRDERLPSTGTGLPEPATLVHDENLIYELANRWQSGVRDPAGLHIEAIAQKAMPAPAAPQSEEPPPPDRPDAASAEDTVSKEDRIVAFAIGTTWGRGKQRQTILRSLGIIADHIAVEEANGERIGMTTAPLNSRLAKAIRDRWNAGQMFQVTMRKEGLIVSVGRDHNARAGRAQLWTASVFARDLVQKCGVGPTITPDQIARLLGGHALPRPTGVLEPPHADSATDDTDPERIEEIDPEKGLEQERLIASLLSDNAKQIETYERLLADAKKRRDRLLALRATMTGSS